MYKQIDNTTIQKKISLYVDEKCNGKLKDDEGFLMWFAEVYFGQDKQLRTNILTGRGGEKSADLIYINKENKKVYVVQGKYHKKFGVGTELRKEIKSVATDIAAYFFGSNRESESYLKKIPVDIANKYEVAKEYIKKTPGAFLEILFLTTKKVIKDHEDESNTSVKEFSENCNFSCFDSNYIKQLVMDYEFGVSPPIKFIDLTLEISGQNKNFYIEKISKNKNLTSFVFSCNGLEIGNLFRTHEQRIFARNIRGYQGDTLVNKDIKATLQNPEEIKNFWFYNNGVTIICSSVEDVTKLNNIPIKRLFNPQIINGQQTTRTLATVKELAKNCSVLVKVIKVDSSIDEEVDSLINNIVQATNWQNKISEADLRSNDSIQRYLERELRQISYLYMRKKESKAEAKKRFNTNFDFIINKEELARAIAACELGPYVVRSGIDALFGKEYYNHIFQQKKIFYYLIRYWLYKRVQNAANPKRYNSKWLTTYVAWNEMSLRLEKIIGERFIKICENKNRKSNLKILGLFEKSFGKIYDASHFFYKKNSGNGKKIDELSFYKGETLSKEFLKFWKKSKYRKSFLKIYKEAILKLEDSDPDLK